MERVAALDALALSPRSTPPRVRGLDENDNHSDDVINLASSAVQWLGVGQVHVRGFGNLDLSREAKMQISRICGIRDWDLLFVNHDPDEIQRTMSTHFAHRQDREKLIFKVIARRLTETEAKTSTADGYLRGIVGPGYSRLRDLEVLDALRVSAGTELDEYRVLNPNIYNRGSWFSFVAPQQHDIGSTAGQKLLGGFKIGNSEIGFGSWSMETFLYLLLCTNGMKLDIGGESLLHRRHVGITSEEVGRLTAEAWSRVPDQRNLAVNGIARLTGIPVERPMEELQRYLRYQPRYVQEAAATAYDEQPGHTAYHVLQALSRVGAAARDVPELQDTLESLSGDYVLRMLRTHPRPQQEAVS